MTKARELASLVMVTEVLEYNISFNGVTDNYSMFETSIYFPIQICSPIRLDERSINLRYHCVKKIEAFDFLFLIVLLCIFFHLFFPSPFSCLSRYP